MSDVPLIMPSDVNPQLLQKIYDAANMQTEFDADNDLLVSAGVSCYVMPTADGDRIQLLSFVGTKEDAAEADKMAFVNRVNNYVSTVRARVNEKGTVLFDYHVPVDGGITAEAILLATQFFMQAMAYAANHCDEGSIMK